MIKNIIDIFNKDKNNIISDNDYKNLQINTLAKTIWGEARGEGEKGMIAVACVILNRYRISKKLKSYWWGNDIITICQKPYQFSCWNRSDSNYQKLIKIDKTNYSFAVALKIARNSLSTKIDDITNGATHYHAKSVNPFWAKNEQPVYILGNHIFYKLIKV